MPFKPISNRKAFWQIVHPLCFLCNRGVGAFFGPQWTFKCLPHASQSNPELQCKLGNMWNKINLQWLSISRKLPDMMSCLDAILGILVITLAVYSEVVVLIYSFVAAFNIL